MQRFQDRQDLSLQLIFFLLCILTSTVAHADIIVEESPIDVYEAYNFTNNRSLSPSRDTPSGSLSELLSQESKLNVYQSGGFGKQSSFFMRGGSRGDQGIFINGVQLQDPLDINRSVDLGTLGADIFDQVDLSFGPHQALFSDNSLSGTISLKSLKTSPNHLKLAVAEKNTRSLSGGIHQGPFSLKASTFSSDNISSANAAKTPFAEADSFQRYSLYAEYRKKTSRSSKLKFFTYQHAAQNEIDSTDFSTNLPTDKRLDDLSTQKLSLNSLQYSKVFPKQALQFDFLLNYKESHRQSSNETYQGQVPEYIQRITYLGQENSLTTMTFKTQREKAISGSSIEKRHLQQYFLGLNHFYERDPFKFQFSLSSIKYEGFDQKYQYQLGMRYKLSANLRTKYLHSKNIKFPSLYQLFAPSSSGYLIGNQNLKPEVTHAHDLFAYYKDYFVLNIYYQKYKRLIQYDTSLGYQNANYARVFGLSPQLKLNYKKLTFTSSMNFMRTQLNDNKQYLERRPREVYSQTLSWAPHSYLLSLRHDYIGQRNDSGRMPSYQLVHFNLQKNYPAKKLNLFFKVTNLFDREYEQIRGYGTFGRLAWLGIQSTF